MSRGRRSDAGVVGIGVAACAACCAGPILGFLAAIGIGTAIGVAVFGVAGVLVALLVVVPYVRRRRRAGAATPIVCTITDDEKPERLELLTRLRDGARTVERTTTGLVLRFPENEGVEADVRRFTVDEKRCCAFWDFSVASEGEEIILRWDGPFDAAPLLDEIDAVLRSDAPIASVGGLL